MTVRIGVDTGGTFTDVVLYDRETATVSVTKTPSTSPNFDKGVLNGIDDIVTEVGAETADIEFLSHGTTVGTNAVLEEEIPDIGLITNEGLRDVLEIGDQTRPTLYDLQAEKPPALIPRRHRKEVPGRLNAEGKVIEPIEEGAVREVARELAEAGVESVVVVMLFAYVNPDHEKAVAEIVTNETGLECVRSSAVHPEIREYDRSITTVLNEAVKSPIADYLARLEEGLTRRDIDTPLNVMHSGGGLFGTKQATESAIRTVLSGPAAGAVATRDISNSEGYDNAIGIDMGGTSSDVSIVRNGAIVRSMRGEINDLPINTPMIDISTVGSGGGSISWIDAGGALRVGPESAGATPGPICYGRGGERPTVTDANLLLGRISPDTFLGGEMELDVETTRDIFRRTIAEPLATSVDEAALSVVQVANASVAREVRRVTVERGHDPANFVLVPFGGAGPMQAPTMARDMDMKAVVIPPNPGVFSARGLLLADVRIDESRSVSADTVDAETISERFNALDNELLDRFDQQDIPAEDIRIDRSLDLRYKGQSYEITVGLENGRIDDDHLEEATETFHQLHERRYGHAMRSESVEIVTVRAHGLVPTVPLDDKVAAAEADPHRGDREVYFADGGRQQTSIFRREAVEPGVRIEGPAILESPGSTAVIPPGSKFRVTESGNIVTSL